MPVVNVLVKLIHTRTFLPLCSNREKSPSCGAYLMGAGPRSLPGIEQPYCVELGLASTCSKEVIQEDLLLPLGLYIYNDLPTSNGT